LARVFSHILAFAGNEFYFSDGKDWMQELYGQRFADTCFRFESAVLIGIKLAHPRVDENGYATSIILNPFGTDVIDEGDSLIFIAEDDDTYWPGDMKLTACGEAPEWSPPATPPTKTLLIGWRRDIQDMLIELDKFVSRGSTCMMLSDGPDIEDRIGELIDANCDPNEDLQNLQVIFEQQNPIFRRELERCNIHEFDSILVLTEERGGDGLSSDSRSMITMLLCRDLQKQAWLTNRSLTVGKRIPCTKSVVIAEILDPRTADLIKLASVDDHIVSNEMISMALGQMSENRDMGILLENLFSPDDSEMHIKDVRAYAHDGETLSFLEIMTRARQNCEIAIGYQRMADKLAGAEDAGIILNPPDKESKIIWQGPRMEGGEEMEGDRIVVISED